jgi:hypothetical protein
LLLDFKVVRALIYFNFLISAFEFWFKTIIVEKIYKEIFEDKKIPNDGDEEKLKYYAKLMI